MFGIDGVSGRDRILKEDGNDRGMVYNGQRKGNGEQGHGRGGRGGTPLMWAPVPNPMEQEEKCIG